MNGQRTDIEQLKQTVEITNRLAEVIGDGSTRAFAREVDIHETTIRKYLSGNLPNNFDALIKIAVKKNVSLNWLLLGIGPKQLN